MSLFKGIFKYIWPQMRRYKFALVSIFILFGIRVIIDAIIVPLYFKRIIDQLSTTGSTRDSLAPELLKIVVLLIILRLILILVSRVCKYIIYTFEINMVRNLRDFSFETISNQSQNFFANTFSGSLVTKSARLIRSFEQMFDILIYDFYNVVILLIGTFVVLYSRVRMISFFMIIFVAIYLTIIIISVRKKIKYDVLEAQSDSRVSGRLADVFGNIFAMKIFSARANEVKKFKEITLDSSEKGKTSWYLVLRVETIQLVLVFITQSSLLYFMVSLWLQGKITTGMVVLIQTFMALIFERLWTLSNALMRFMKASADMKEVIDIFETVPDILDPNNPEKLNINSGNIIFDNVSFKYNNGQKVFEDFNLNIKAGERIGLVGHSGAGKSTFTNLILRFSDVENGSITIDGQDVRNIKQDDLRSAISYVPQESILFHRSIKENIAYGKPDATDKEIISVAEKAHAHEFIVKLPNGYDTLVGERGVKLSGGERQRVAIARAMIKDAPVLILDEATSSLDSISESYIQDALNELMKGKTTIVIAHRLSTIQKMDRILVLDDGEIIEEGTHAELIAKSGNYADLWNHQVGGFIA